MFPSQLLSFAATFNSEPKDKPFKHELRMNIPNVLRCSILTQVIETGRHLVALSCSIKLVNAIVSAEKRETPITDVSVLYLV